MRALHLQKCGQIEARGVQVRSQTQRLSELLDGEFLESLVRIGHGQVVVRLSNIGMACHKIAKGLDRFIQPSLRS